LADSPIRVCVSGATGVTGSLAVEALCAAEGFVLAGALAAPGEAGETLSADVVVTDDAATALRGADVVIDFSAPAAVDALVEALAAHPRPAVIGTTALPDEVVARIASLAQQVPVVLAPNMSLGVNVLRRLVQSAVQALGPGWDAEIIEIHHRRKVDAPSGTAMALAHDLSAATGRVAEGALELGRRGAAGPRGNAAIGVHAVRGGDVVGEHTVLLLGDGERIELTHRAGDRRTFAAGALRAARWVMAPGRTPGLYGMNDVL
jgi:4-hydroxy-tetrahydrodipicolinate reductase